VLCDAVRCVRITRRAVLHLRDVDAPIVSGAAKTTQSVAVCYSVLQCGAVCCSAVRVDYASPRFALQNYWRGNDNTECCGVLQCVAVCCSVLLCVAVCCSVLQCAAVCCCVLLCVAVFCRVLLCVAGCCSVLQGVAVCCSVLQCLARGVHIAPFCVSEFRTRVRA